MIRGRKLRRLEGQFRHSPSARAASPVQVWRSRSQGVSHLVHSNKGPGPPCRRRSGFSCRRKVVIAALSRDSSRNFRRSQFHHLPFHVAVKRVAHLNDFLFLCSTRRSSTIEYCSRTHQISVESFVRADRHYPFTFSCRAGEDRQFALPVAVRTPIPQRHFFDCDGIPPFGL
jgi:hypothetical protein